MYLHLNFGKLFFLISRLRLPRLLRFSQHFSINFEFQNAVFFSFFELTRVDIQNKVGTRLKGTRLKGSRKLSRKLLRKSAESNSIEEWELTQRRFLMRIYKMFGSVVSWLISRIFQSLRNLWIAPWCVLPNKTVVSHLHENNLKKHTP